MILVSLRYDDGIAAVYRDDDGAWLGAGPDTASLGGMLLDTNPGRLGIGRGRLVAGGLLPPGAAVAIVEGTRATTGHGAWVAVIDEVETRDGLAARYEADDGTVVRPALPAGEGAWYGLPRAPWRRLRGLRRRRRHRPTPPVPPPIGKLEFPIYSLAGAVAEPTGRGWDAEGVHSVTVRHDGIEITTRALRHALIDAHGESTRALRAVIEDAEPLDWGRGSPAARALRIHAHDRALAARVARAEPFAVELPVDDEPLRFAGLRDPAGWAVVGDTDQVRIVVGARGVAPEAVALRTR
jgi:hypothetical protein